MLAGMTFAFFHSPQSSNGFFATSGAERQLSARVRQVAACAPQGDEKVHTVPSIGARGSEPAQVRIVLAGLDLLRRGLHLVPGLGRLKSVLLEQVLAVEEELRVRVIGQGHDLAVHGVGFPIGGKVPRHDLLLVGSKVGVERLGPLRGRPLRRTNHVDQHEIERRVARCENGVEILLLLLRGRAADLDFDLHVRVALLVLVEHLAHHVSRCWPPVKIRSVVCARAMPDVPSIMKATADAVRRVLRFTCFSPSHVQGRLELEFVSAPRWPHLFPYRRDACARATA